MDSVVLEVAVGLTLVFYVTATLVTGMAEGLTRLLNTRSKLLWATLARLMTPSTSVTTLGAPFIFKSLAPGRWDPRERDRPSVPAGSQMQRSLHQAARVIRFASTMPV